jgi:hypothetical protein
VLRYLPAAFSWVSGACFFAAMWGALGGHAGVTAIFAVAGLLMSVLSMKERPRQIRAMLRTPVPLEPKSHADVLRFVTHADQLLHSGQVEAAIPMYREVIEHPNAGRRIRGMSASLLGWILVGRYPDDPVPDEVRRLLTIATHEQPRQCQTLQLAAYIYAYDGDGAGSLRAIRLARRRKPRDPGVTSQLLCIGAIAHVKLGQHVDAARLRAEAAGLWPENELLAEVDAAISSATH